MAVRRGGDWRGRLGSAAVREELAQRRHGWAAGGRGGGIEGQAQTDSVAFVGRDGPCNFHFSASFLFIFYC